MSNKKKEKEKGKGEEKERTDWVDSLEKRLMEAMEKVLYYLKEWKIWKGTWMQRLKV